MCRCDGGTVGMWCCESGMQGCGSVLRGESMLASISECHSRGVVEGRGRGQSDGVRLGDAEGQGKTDRAGKQASGEISLSRHNREWRTE